MAYAYNLDKALGCIVGGAVGDALGYPMEFRRSFDEIQQLCGPNGISRYRLEEGGTTHFSDDTQMTLKHTDSFEDAVVAAVNHSGDSDSTGAICGNIMGLVHGYEAIPTHFKEHLELLPLLEEVAADLYTGSARTTDPYWDGHRP